MKPEDYLHEEKDGNPRILVVEDSEDVRAHLIENLSEQFAIEEAVDGEEGLKLAVESIPDLVISDLMMLKTDERTSLL